MANTNTESDAAATPLAVRPLTRLNSFEELYRAAKDRRFANPMRIRVEVEKVRPAVPDLEAFLAPAHGVDREYLVVRGTMIAAAQGCPPVMFRINLSKDFPTRFPEVTIEHPPQGCGLALGNSPNVDSQGVCYLHSVSNWSPPQSSIFSCMAELQQSVQRHHPFVRVAQQAPPPPRQAAAPPQGPPPAMPPQPYQQQAQQPQYPQHHQQQPVPLPQPIGGAPTGYQPSPPPPPPSSAPPVARGMDEVWAMLTTLIFTKGEEELASGRATMDGRNPEQCQQLVAAWGRAVLTEALMRRRGSDDGLMLPSGALLRREQVTAPAQRDIFDHLMTAQSTGEMGFLEHAWPLIRADPEWRVKLANTVDVLGSMYGAAPPQQQQQQLRRVTIEDVWKGFFSAAFAVGEHAVAEGILRHREIVDQEPFLYLGLTALTALGVVKRSPPSGPMRLALGDTDLTYDNCPPEGHQLLGAFMTVRDMFVAARLSGPEEAALRRAVLLSGHDRGGAHQEQQLRPDVARIVGALQSIAVSASQQPAFHQNFGQVLDLLAACTAP